jgi:hypothetical protein
MNHKAVVFALTIFFIRSLCGQEKSNLEFRYLAGSVYRYGSTVMYDSQQAVLGEETKIAARNRSVMKIECVAVDTDSSMTLDALYEEMQTTVQSTGVIDTIMEHPGLIGKRHRVVMSRYGKEIRREVADTSTDDTGMGLMSLTNLKNINFFPMPGRAIGAGEQWVEPVYDSADIGEGYTVRQGFTDYKLAGSEENSGRLCMKISFVSRCYVTGKISQTGMNFVIEGSSDTDGTIWFDANAGILVKQDTRMTQELTFAMSEPMPLNIPVEETIRSTYTLIIP